ncbi:MAG: ferritin family protein [Thermodesulfobacteriota bacterium]|nr:ferritin family protein [Thermodesulfobacteriota bacterium]
MKKDIGRSLKMLSKALEMEEKGRAFYERVVSTCTNSVGREMFKILLEDEKVHMDRIKKIYEALSGREIWRTWDDLEVKHGDLAAIFRKMAKEHGSKINVGTDDLEALDIGIDFEARSVEFYEEQLKKATDNLEKAFIKEMISEEKSHYVALQDMKLYLSDPASWFREKEHGGLDGG